MVRGRQNPEKRKVGSSTQPLTTLSHLRKRSLSNCPCASSNASSRILVSFISSGRSARSACREPVQLAAQSLWFRGGEWILPSLPQPERRIGVVVSRAGHAVGRMQMIRYGLVARSCDRLGRRSEWREESCRLSAREVLVCEARGGGAVADSRSDALHRAVAGVSRGEDARY
jgi:hypothetical protein